jgi:hypothetical protein
MYETTSNPSWPFLVYDRWAAFLYQWLLDSGAKPWSTPTLQAPLDAVIRSHNVDGVFFCADMNQSSANGETVFQSWLKVMRIESVFELDLLGELIAKGTVESDDFDVITSPESRMARAWKHPIQHPPSVAVVLRESRGYLFYRDQPARVLALVLGCELHRTGFLLKGTATDGETEDASLRFVNNLQVHGVGQADARSLWQNCLQRYRLCLPRDWLIVRREQVLWLLAARQAWPETFTLAWQVFSKSHWAPPK